MMYFLYLKDMVMSFDKNSSLFHAIEDLIPANHNSEYCFNGKSSVEFINHVRIEMSKLISEKALSQKSVNIGRSGRIVKKKVADKELILNLNFRIDKEIFFLSRVLEVFGNETESLSNRIIVYLIPTLTMDHNEFLDLLKKEKELSINGLYETFSSFDLTSILQDFTDLGLAKIAHGNVLLTEKGAVIPFLR